MVRAFVEFYEYVRRYCREYLTEQRKLSGHTIRYYRDTLNSFIRFLKEKHTTDHTGLSLDMVSQPAVLEYLAWLSKQGNSVATQNRRLAALKIFVQYVAMWDQTFLGVAHQIQSIKGVKQPEHLVGFLNQTEVAGLLRAPNPESVKGRRDRLLLILLYETACRVAEVVRLRYSDFVATDTGCAVTLTGKGNKTRVVPVSLKVFNHVQQYRLCTSGEGFIFPTSKGHLTTSSVYKIVRTNGERIGVASLHPHTLRHSRAMHWYQGGMALEIVAQLLGHAHLSTTRIYAWADVEMKRRAIDKADQDSKSIPESNQEIFDWNDENLLNRLCGLR